MTRKTKTGSSRRKGDEFQDLTALQLALERYIAGGEFELFIEYEKAGSMDDVVIVTTESVDCFQIKHAVNRQKVYSLEDFTGSDSVVHLGKFADSWKRLSTLYPNRKLRLHLRSNRGVDAQLSDVITHEGYFNDQFLDNRYYKEKRDIRNKLLKASTLPAQEFQEFLRCFHFDLNQPSYLDLEQEIKAFHLDHKLGISDTRVFADLKRLIEQHAIEIPDPITPILLNAYFRETQSRYLLPQLFHVDETTFVPPPTLADQLNNELHNVQRGYVVVTGPPGSGKSTALSKYFDELSKERFESYEVIRYYCFVRVHDNEQRKRVEAKSLRVNLLTELQIAFPEELNSRRFDFDEQNFLTALEKAGACCVRNNRKLVVFIDGLDHVERDPALRDAIINALPKELPEGVVVVIGSQELRHWRPLALQQARDDHHVQMPLFSQSETNCYVEEKRGLSLTKEQLRVVHEKSGGLPLCLAYLSELIDEPEDLALLLDELPNAVDGDIKTYYQMLWSTFEAEGWNDAKYVSSVLCQLRFSVHENEVFGFQSGLLDRPRFAEAFKKVRHLLRYRNGLISIFHDSFRVFVLAQTPADTKNEIAEAIHQTLKSEEMRTPRWFKHAFSYAYESNDYKYITSKVNTKFVDSALMRFREEEEIIDAIEIAVNAAEESGDLTALARLGSLKYRTSERLEHTFPWSTVANILIAGGGVDQVLDSVYSEELQRILTSPAYTMNVIVQLIDCGHMKSAETLLRRLLNDRITYAELGSSGIIDLAYAAGTFALRTARVLRWISDAPASRSDTPAVTLSSTNPALTKYVESLSKAGRKETLQRLKRISVTVPNHVMRASVIRAVARHGEVGELKQEIEEFRSVHAEKTDLEVAMLAVQARLPIDQVNALAGCFAMPAVAIGDGGRYSEREVEIHRFGYWAIVLGYDTEIKESRLLERIGTSRAVWSSALRHLVAMGELVSAHFDNRTLDWFEQANSAVVEIENATDIPGERTSDALDVFRGVLPFSLHWISQVIVSRTPERIDDWISVLARLRESFVWNTHYGIGEYRDDFTFEFCVWESQSRFPPIRSRMLRILESCAESYKQARSLKAGSRGIHLIQLAEMAAKCGFKTAAESWMSEGIECTLAYGYRKDTTMSNLIHVLGVLDKRQPDRTVARSAALLEMIKWMRNATDERMTMEFPQELFPVMVANNESAAIRLLRVYYEQLLRWQANETLEKHLLSRQQGTGEYLWALASLIDPNDSVAVREHIADLSKRSNPEVTKWDGLYSSFVSTMVSPCRWPSSHVAKHPRRQEFRSDQLEDRSLSEREYSLDGALISPESVVQLCLESFSKMKETMQKLKDQNLHVSDHDLFGTPLDSHLAKASTTDEVEDIYKFFLNACSFKTASQHERFAIAFFDVGNAERGLQALESSIHENFSRSAFELYCQRDRVRAIRFVCQSIATKLKGPSHNGFRTPVDVALIFDALEDEESLETVFDDYLLHCEELFAQYSGEHCFDELRTSDVTEVHENIQIVNLLIDRLDAAAIQFGTQLTVALFELAMFDVHTVAPVIIDRLSNAEGMQRLRLLDLLDCVAAMAPAVLRGHDNCLVKLLSVPNFFIRSQVSRIVGSDLKASASRRLVDSAAEKVERDYSPTQSYRGFSIPNKEPSVEFIKMLHLAAVPSLQRQIEASAEILSVDLSAALANLESRLLATGTSVEVETSQMRSYWSGFSHAQGWPVTWFVSETETCLETMFHEMLDEIVTRTKVPAIKAEALWRVVQRADREYICHTPTPMPSDISPLNVTEDNTVNWIQRQQDPAVPVEESLGDEWVTLFESCEVSQDAIHFREYRSKWRTQSCLFNPSHADELRVVGDEFWAESVCTHHPAENLTLEQFREALTNGHEWEADPNAPFIPLVGYKDCFAGFVGFKTIASFSSAIFKRFDLDYRGFDVFHADKLVGRFIAWQEGFPNNDYDDEPLSHGVRFQAKSEFIDSVCKEFASSLAHRTVESRQILDEYKPTPKQESERSSLRFRSLATNS